MVMAVGMDVVEVVQVILVIMVAIQKIHSPLEWERNEKNIGKDKGDFKKSLGNLMLLLWNEGPSVAYLLYAKTFC